MKYTRPEGLDHSPFHDKIAENTREDTPSLVYADWLEENDQPHLAAFVREVVRTKNDYTNRDRVARIMHYAHRPQPDRAAPGVNSVYNYMGLGAHRESGRGRKKSPTTTEVSVQSPYSEDRHGYLSFSLDVPDVEAAEWTKRLISEGHPPANHARSSSLRRAVDAHAQEVAAANAPPPPDAVDHNATKLSRLLRRVVRYSEATNHEALASGLRMLSSAEHEATRRGDETGDRTFRGQLADLLQDHERETEAYLLRSGRPVFVHGDQVRAVPRHVEIRGRRWFQRSAGNTYHTAHVYLDGQHVLSVPRQYGYGQQYVDSAMNALEHAGLIPPRLDRNNGHREADWQWRERHGVRLETSVEDVPRQRDLDAPPNPT